MAAPQPFEGTPLSSTDTGDMLRFMGKGATGDFAYCFEAVYGNADVTTKLAELHNFLMSMVCAGEGRFSVLFRLVVEIGTVALCFAVDSGAFDAKVWDRTELASALHTPTAVQLYTVSLLCPREVAEAKASQFSSWALRQFSSQQEPGKPRVDAKANVAHWTKRTPALAEQIVSLLNSIDTVKASAVVAFADNGQSGDSTAWFKPMHSVFVSDTTRLESVRSIVNRLTVEMSGETPGETVQVGPRCDVLHSLHGDCQRPWGGSTNGELSADEIQSARKLFCDPLLYAQNMPAIFLYDVACKVERRLAGRLPGVLGLISCWIDAFHAVNHKCRPDFSWDKYRRFLIKGLPSEKELDVSAYRQAEPHVRSQMLREYYAPTISSEPDYKKARIAVDKMNSSAAEQFNSVAVVLKYILRNQGWGRAMMTIEVIVNLYNLGKIKKMNV